MKLSDIELTDEQATELIRLLQERVDQRQQLHDVALAFVGKWRDGTVWGSEDLRHFTEAFARALRI